VQRAALKKWIEQKLQSSGKVLTDAEIDGELARLIREMRATTVSKRSVVQEADSDRSSDKSAEHSSHGVPQIPVDAIAADVDACSETTAAYDPPRQRI